MNAPTGDVRTLEIKWDAVAPEAATGRAQCRGKSWTTCWKVGRFWNGNGGRLMALAEVKRSWSKQLGCGLVEQSPRP